MDSDEAARDYDEFLDCPACKLDGGINPHTGVCESCGQICGVEVTHDLG